MGFALIWSEGLMVALLGLALAAAWLARGRAVRALWVACVFLVFFIPAAAAAVGTYGIASSESGRWLRTSWFPYAGTWLVAYTLLGALLVRHGLRRPQPGLARSAATWPRARLWLGIGAAALALGVTFWNMDLAVRADLALARQEAGALLLSMTPPPVAAAENAAGVYARSIKDPDAAIPNRWYAAARRGLDAKEPVDWQDPFVVELMKDHEDSLALMRQGAAMPACNFDYQRSLLDAATASKQQVKMPRVALLAMDARVKAAQGNLPRAFEDISAILGIERHVAGQMNFGWDFEGFAWRTLEDVLRLAPSGQEPLPPLVLPEAVPLVRMTRQEHALLGILLPTIASQPSLVSEDERKRMSAWDTLQLQTLAVLPTRIFVLPDEVAAMHKLFDEYQHAPRAAQDETPQHWADLNKSVETDLTSIFSAFYIKPKHQVILVDAASLAALRHVSQAGLAAARYRRKHGHYPKQLEQLVPEFLPAAPVDPRDGQPLCLKRVGDDLVVYAPQDSAALTKSNLRDPESRRPAPIFRLPMAVGKMLPKAPSEQEQ
jgi:hypothetical protein